MFSFYYPGSSAIGKQPGKLMCSPLTYSTINNLIQGPRMCSSTATGTGRNSDQARLTVAGKFFCLCPKKWALRTLSRDWGCQEVTVGHCDRVQWVLRKATQRGSLGGEGQAFDSTSGTWAAKQPPRKVIRGLWLSLDQISPDFCPQESKSEAMQIRITWVWYVVILISPWAGHGIGPQGKYVIRSSVGGCEWNSLKIIWTSVLMSVFASVH